VFSLSGSTEKTRRARHHHRGLFSRILRIWDAALFLLFFIHHLLPHGQTVLARAAVAQDADAVSGGVSQQPPVAMLPLPVQAASPAQPPDPGAEPGGGRAPLPGSQPRSVTPLQGAGEGQ